MTSRRWKPIERMSVYVLIIVTSFAVFWRLESKLSEMPNPMLQKGFQLIGYMNSMKEEDPSFARVDANKRMDVYIHPENLSTRDKALKLKFSPSIDEIEKALGQPDENLKDGGLVWKGANAKLVADRCTDKIANVCALELTTVLRHRGFLSDDDYEEERVTLSGAGWKYRRVVQ